MKRVFRCLLCSVTCARQVDAIEHAKTAHSLSTNAKDYILEREVDDLAGDTA